MPMIFHRFPNHSRAVQFAAAASELLEDDVAVFTSVHDAQQADPIQVELVAPVVHVARQDDPELEQTVEQLVAVFGGSFAGT